MFWSGVHVILVFILARCTYDTSFAVARLTYVFALLLTLFAIILVYNCDAEMGSLTRSSPVIFYCLVQILYVFLSEIKMLLLLKSVHAFN